MQNIKNDLFQFEVGKDGIAIMTIDQVNNPTNLFGMAFIEEFINCLLYMSPSPRDLSTSRMPSSA